MFRFIIEGVLLTIVSAFGIIGNIIAIYILSRPIMKASFSTLLIGMWCIQKIWSRCKLYQSHFNKFYQFMIGCHLYLPIPDFYLIEILLVYKYFNSLIDIDYSKILKYILDFFEQLAVQIQFRNVLKKYVIKKTVFCLKHSSWTIKLS